MSGLEQPQIFHEGLKLLLALALSFLLGLERQERYETEGPTVFFGGARTFSLIGLMGYALALLSGQEILPLAAGLIVIGGFMWLSYRQKLALSADAGITSEISGLSAFVVGALVYHDQLWIALTWVVLALLLLEVKQGLHALIRRIPADEVFHFTQFLLLSAVILPLVPNQPYTEFQINPFKTWLVVVAVSGISYVSYVLRRLLGSKGSVQLSAILGGAYSSTVATVVLAKRSQEAKGTHLFSGGILMASGVMYFRFLVLLLIFNHALMSRLLVSFAALGGGALLFGWLWSRMRDLDAGRSSVTGGEKNPLEIKTAFFFAAVFVVALVLTHWVSTRFGTTGVYVLAALMGASDVDPFILGIAQGAAHSFGQVGGQMSGHMEGAFLSLPVAASSIAIAAASNNLIKGFYALFFGDRAVGRRSLTLLAALAVLGVLPLFWLL